MFDMAAVRLSIARCAYAHTHIDDMVEAVLEPYAMHDTIRPLMITEAPRLRHANASRSEIDPRPLVTGVP